MEPVTASGAAFEGFRLVRERPLAVVVWTLLWLVGSAAGAVITFRIGDPMAEFQQLAEGPAWSSPMEYLSILARAVPTAAIYLMFYAVISAAAYRLVLRREERPPPLKLGGDELRQFLLMIVIGLVILGVEVAFLTLLFIVAGLTMQASPAAGSILFALSFVLVLGVVIYVAVRLSLAGPMTLDRGRLSPFGSWALTRGRFWSLFGSYFLAFLLAVVVTLVGGVLIAIVATLLGGGLTAAAAMAVGEVTSVQELFNPVRLVFLVGYAVLSALTFVIISATPAVIYRGLTTAGAQATVP